ncbi:MAG: hypothetical protein AAF806_33065, partial [Bacteroidota bacterium]
MAASLKLNLLFLLLTTTLLVFGQDYTLSSVPLPKDNEISNNRIIHALQDSDEFIWLLTQNGIARFDGYRYQWFNKTNSQLRAIPNPRQIAEDADGYLWLNQNDKIDLLHHRTYELIPFEEKFAEIAKEAFICKRIIPFSEGRIFIELLKNESREYYLYEPNEGIERLSYLPEEERFEIRGESDAIWITSIDEFWWKKLDLESGEILKEVEFSPQQYSDIKLIPGSGDFGDLFSAKLGKVSFILEVDENNAIKERFRFNTKTDKTGLQSFYFYNEQTRQILTFVDDRLAAIDLEEGKKIDFKTGKDENRRINGILLIDSKGIVWTKSVKEGVKLCKIYRSNFKFHPPKVPIRGMRVKDGFLFTNRHEISLTTPDEYTPIKLNNVRAYEVSNQDALWMGYEKGIRNIDPAAESTQKEVWFSKAVLDVPNTSMWSLLQDEQSRWWCGMSQGLVCSKADSDSLY